MARKSFIDQASDNIAGTLLRAAFEVFRGRPERVGHWLDDNGPVEEYLKRAGMVPHDLFCVERDWDQKACSHGELPTTVAAYFEAMIPYDEKIEEAQ